jgi:hypothetical protein
VAVQAFGAFTRLRIRACYNFPMSQPPAPFSQMSDAQMRAYLDFIAAEAARRAVRDTLSTLGLDPSDPAQLRDWHADLQWTRSARQGSGRLSMTVKTTLVGTLTTGLLYLLWSLFQRSIDGQ